MQKKKLHKLMLFSLIFMLTFGSSITSAFAWQAKQETLNEMTDQVDVVEHTQKIYIAKTLSGNYPESDVNKEFAFTLTINDSVKYDFTLKAGKSTSYEIQKGAKYTVTEADYTSSGYTPEKKIYSGTAGDEDIYITYVNVYKKSSGDGGGHHTTPDPDKPDDPNKPDGGDDPDPITPDSGDDDNTGGNTTDDKNKTDGNTTDDKKTETKVPKTGDESMLTIWILVLLISVEAGLVIVIDEKIRPSGKLPSRKK